MTENTKDCKQCEFRELNYKRAYLRLFNRVWRIQVSLTELLEDALIEAEHICTSDDDDDSND